MRVRGCLGAGVGVAMAVGLAGAAAADTTAATIVQNRDEPARNYYQESVSGVCSQYSCTAVFTPVKAHTRRVVQYITCDLARDGSEQNLTAWVNYTQGGAYSYLAPLILTQTGTTSLGSPNGNVEYAVSSNVVFYFQPNVTPAINFRTDAMVDKPSGSCVMSGYFVDLP